MEKTFVEILDILKDGPNKGVEDVYLHVFDIILSCTGHHEAKQYFSVEFVKAVIKFIGSNSPYNTVIYRILINIFSEEDLDRQLSENTDIATSVVNLSVSDVLNKESKNADHGCMLLTNITRSYSGCLKIVELIVPLEETFNKMVSALTTVNYNSSCSLDQLAMVLCNLSQLTAIRKIITEEDHGILQKLVPLLNHSSIVRRRGIVGVLHNCSFDSTIHNWLLGNKVDILSYLLLPLAGPEQFDDEDNDKLPIDLQYLPDTKTREPDPEIRKQLLQTLNQLCATKFGRQFMRDHNTYIILRELHKWEQDQSALMACENVVDILIRTEDEIGCDHLKQLIIPESLEEQFNRESVN